MVHKLYLNMSVEKFLKGESVGIDAPLLAGDVMEGQKITPD